MGDCLSLDYLSRHTFSGILRPLFFVASLALVFLVIFSIQSATAHAASSVVWGEEIYDDETGELISDDRVFIGEGGTYQVTLGVEKEIYVENMDYFATYGHLYKIDDSTNERTDLGLIGTGTFYEFTWHEYGVYEIDIFDAGEPILSERPLGSRIFAFLFGDTAHAEAGDFIETIHFTLEESAPAPSGNSNVAFFPGVQSTYLYADGFLGEDQVWTPTVGVLDNDVKNLSMHPDGTSKEDVYTKEGDIVSRAYGLMSIYEGFPATMDTLVAGRVINAWKPISYDWRLDLDTLLASGKKSGEKISYLSATSTPYIYQELKNLADTAQNGKVSIIAHSNGGLLAKAFLADLEARHDPLLEKIDTVVLVASPQLGTPKTLLPMLHGSQNALSVFNIGLEEKTWREAARYTPSAYNLIPSSAYFTQNTPVISFDQSLDSLADSIRLRDVSGATGDGLSSVFDYRSRYGNEITTYAELTDFLQGVEGRPDPDYADVQHPAVLSSALLANTHTLHGAIDTWTPPDLDDDGEPDIRVVQIAGFGVPTIKGVHYATKKNIQACSIPPGQITRVCGFVYGVEANPILSTRGDETVVLNSASAMSSETYYIDIVNYNKDKNLTGDVIARKHANIMASQPVTQALTHILQGNPVSSVDYISASAPTSAGDLTVLEMHSPVELEVFDPDGGRLGWMTDSQSGVRYLEEKIPNASYWKVGDATFIALPSDAAYTVKLDGMASGTFSFKTKKLVKDVVTKTTSFSDIPVTASLAGSVIVPTSAVPTQLVLDTDGDGTTDTTIKADGTAKTLPQLFAEFNTIVTQSSMDKGFKVSLLALSKAAEKLTVVGKRPGFKKVSLVAMEVIIKGKTNRGIKKIDADKLLAILKEIKALLKQI